MIYSIEDSILGLRDVTERILLFLFLFFDEVEEISID